MISGRVGAWPEWWPSDPMQPAMPGITSKADPNQLNRRARLDYGRSQARQRDDDAGDVIGLLFLLMGVL